MFFVLGTPSEPHTRNVTILLHGTKATRDYAISNSFNLGSKVLGIYKGGRVEMYGSPVEKRWTRVSSTSLANTSLVDLSESASAMGWVPGQRIIVTSSSYNPWHVREAHISTLRQLSLLICDA